MFPAFNLDFLVFLYFLKTRRIEKERDKDDGRLVIGNGISEPVAVQHF